VATVCAAYRELARTLRTPHVADAVVLLFFEIYIVSIASPLDASNDPAASAVPRAVRVAPGGCRWLERLASRWFAGEGGL